MCRMVINHPARRGFERGGDHARRLRDIVVEQAREAFGRMSRDQRLEKKEKLMLPFRQTVKCRKEDRNIMILLALDDGGGMLAR